jgi:hypothetical protein
MVLFVQDMPPPSGCDILKCIHRHLIHYSMYQYVSVKFLVGIRNFLLSVQLGCLRISDIFIKTLPIYFQHVIHTYFNSTSANPPQRKSWYRAIPGGNQPWI